MVNVPWFTSVFPAGKAKTFPLFFSLLLDEENLLAVQSNLERAEAFRRRASKTVLKSYLPQVVLYMQIQ